MRDISRDGDVPVVGITVLEIHVVESVLFAQLLHRGHGVGLGTRLLGGLNNLLENYIK